MANVATLNPYRITVTNHACVRWLERLHKIKDDDVKWDSNAIAHAEDELRELLMLCYTQSPSATSNPKWSEPGRKYRVDDLILVVSADYQRLLTVYTANHPSSPKSMRHKRKNRKGVH